jgi:hypothetical protein
VAEEGGLEVALRRAAVEVVGEEVKCEELAVVAAIVDAGAEEMALA